MTESLDSPLLESRVMSYWRFRTVESNDDNIKLLHFLLQIFGQRLIFLRSDTHHPPPFGFHSTWARLTEHKSLKTEVEMAIS